MKKTVVASLLLLMIMSAIQPLRAQNRNSASNDDGLEGDQISEMLDSLVNIRNLSRANFKKPTKSNFQPNEVPTYPDEVYRQRLARLQSPIPFEYNSEVKKYIDLYVNRRRELSSITLGLSKLYFPLFEQTLDMYQLPVEFKYLAVVESALNPMAVSRVGATGLWQFMYATGKLYNLEINSNIDERRDVAKSTIAACMYFKEMYNIYHDWLLVIAAYNCGPGNINKAIARSGGKRTFWEICKYLPKETRGYVPAFIAVNYMMNYAAEHNIQTMPSVISYFELDTLNITKRLSLTQVSNMIGINVEMLRFLNPLYKRGFIPFSDDRPYKLIIPANKVSAFLANSDNLYKNFVQESYSTPVVSRVFNQSFASLKKGKKEKVKPEVKVKIKEEPVIVVKDVRRVHIVKRGDNLDILSNKYDCTLAELKKWNHLSGGRVRPGQRLIIYVASEGENRILTSNEPEKKEEVAISTTVEKPTHTVKYIYHVVQHGDTLWNIAQRYNGVTVAQLKQINRINNSKDLKPGTRIKVALIS